jgi:hypothetical protein
MSRFSAHSLGCALLLGALAGAAQAQVPPRDRIPRPAAPDTAVVDPAVVDRPPAMAADSAPAQRPPSGPDPVMESLLRLPGYTATRFRGDTAHFDGGRGTLRLIGGSAPAEVERAGEKITGEVVTYYEGRRAVRAEGSPRLSSRDAEDLEGRVMYYDLETHKASVVGGRTRLMDGAPWIVHGNVTSEGRDRFYASHGRFTTCDLEVPHYHFEADQIVMIRGSVMVARPARLYFGGVPVVSLPFIVQSLKEGRRSGILTPRFGIADIVQTSSRQRRQIDNVGAYWAINDYMDAKVVGGWQSGRYTSLNGQLDYNFRRQFLNGGISYTRFWQEDGSRNLTLRTQNAWRPTERTNISVAGNYASSSSLIRDISFDPRQATQNLQSNATLSHGFSWGSLNLSANRTQQLADGLVTTGFPNASLSLNPITLFRAPVTTAQWYNNGTYRSSFDYRQSSTRIPLDTTGLPFLDPADSASVAPYLGMRRDFGDGTFNTNHSLSFGNLSLDARGGLRQGVQQRHPLYDLLEPVEGLRPGSLERTDSLAGQWSTSASYRVGLMGSTSISPNIAMERDFRRSPGSGDELVGAPARLNFGAGMNTDLYGFFPGVAGFSAIRHKVSPQFSYRYSPEVVQTDRQEAVFGTFSGRAQNQVTMSLRQTFEGRVRTPPPAQSDTAEVAGRSQAAPQPARTVTLLGVNTTLPGFDFVRSREDGVGWMSSSMSNTISSDYMRGLSLSVEHQLFDPAAIARRIPGSAADTLPRESVRFSPRLMRINAGFSIDKNSPIVRGLGAVGRLLGRGDDAAPARDDLEDGEETDRGLSRMREEPGLPGEGLDGPGRGLGGGGGGPWRANLTYSFQRNPSSIVDIPAMQNLNGNMNFSLSPNWGVSWRTGYNITETQFTDHVLSLTRNLHRWQAEFSYFVSPNGNTAFGLRVHLLDNQDLKFEHHDRSFGSDRGGAIDSLR